MKNIEGTESLNEMDTQESTQAADSVNGSSNSADGDTLTGSVESVQVDADQQTFQTDLSFNVATIFVLAMLVGLVIFHILSRRWQT